MRMFFKNVPNFDFLKAGPYAYLVSGLVILASIISLVIHQGPNMGIDFTGGTLVQFSFYKPLELADLRQAISGGGFTNSEIQSFPQHNSFTIRVKGREESAVSEKITELIKAAFPENRFEIDRVEYVGPAVGEFLVRQAFWAIIFSLFGIVVYVAFRFRSAIWGVAGVLALIHDVFVTVGIFSILDKEITITVIAALLTLAGYSINDTIVIFDRMRENIRLLRKEDLRTLINRSINETLARTILTSLTTFLAVLALFLFGGEVIHDFAFALLFGFIAGSYSTIFLASPIVYFWNTRRSAAYNVETKGKKKG